MLISIIRDLFERFPRSFTSPLFRKTSQNLIIFPKKRLKRLHQKDVFAISEIFFLSWQRRLTPRCDVAFSIRLFNRSLSPIPTPPRNHSCFPISYLLSNYVPVCHSESVCSSIVARDSSNSDGQRRFQAEMLS